MEKKFTKGEWVFYDSPEYHNPKCSSIEVQQINSPYWICKVQNKGYIGKEEGLANAKLIAAAPTMLEALESFVYEIENTRSNDNIFEESYNLAIQAIKKATE